LSHSTSSIFVKGFQDRVLWTICLGWLWNSILLISVFWVVRTIDVSHWHLAQQVFLFVLELGLELRVSCLIVRYSTTWATPLDHSSALRRLRQKDYELEVGLYYIARCCLKKIKKLLGTGGSRCWM
jgi:hypothetical protein